MRKKDLVRQYNKSSEQMEHLSLNYSKADD